MELRHLRYFVAVGEALNFTRAAEKLHLAQPSLSRQIQDLEEEIGVRLLNRSRQGVSLTASGKSFLADAKRVLAHGVEIVESVQRLDREEKCDLNIGYVAALIYDLLPATLAAFQTTFPAVPVHLFDMTCGDQLRALADGKIDLGFVGSMEVRERAGIQSRPIAAYKTVTALPKHHHLARRSTVKLKDLEPMFFVGISEHSRPGYRQWLTETCEKAGYKPRVLQEVDLERSVLQAVAGGLGIALLPEPVKKIPHPDVVFRPVSPALVTPFWMAWREENKTPALKAYVRIVADFDRRAGESSNRSDASVDRKFQFSARHRTNASSQLREGRNACDVRARLPSINEAARKDEVEGYCPWDPCRFSEQSSEKTAPP